MCVPRVTRNTSIQYSSSCHTHVNMGASIFFTAAMIRDFRTARSRRWVLRVLCTKFTLHSNHRLTRVIFQHTKRLLPRSGHFLTTYTHIAYRQKCELRWKTTYWKKKVLSSSFCLCRFRKYMSYGIPIINYYNPEVHYETPCIIIGILWWQHVSIILLTILRPNSTSKKYITQYALIVPLSYESWPEDVLKKDWNILP
jgi:hypothetical protein